MLKLLRHRLFVQVVLCTGLLMVTAPPTVMAQPKPLSAWETARQFYLWTLRHPGRGLPSEAGLTQLTPLLAPEVNTLLKQALSAEVRCDKAMPPDTKPPVAEGDFFVNNYEGATVLNRLKVMKQSSEIELEAELAYVDRRFPPGHRHHAFRWRDRFTLAQFSGRWRITDIRFTDRPSLVAMLKDYLVELKKCAPQE